MMKAEKTLEASHIRADRKLAKVARKINDDIRASLAFIEALHRTEDMVFSRDDITISEKKKIGDPVVCTIEARKRNGISSQAKGKAFIYIPIWLLSVWKVCVKDQGLRFILTITNI